MRGKRKAAKKSAVKRKTAPISAGYHPVPPYLSIRAQARSISDPVIHGSV